MESCRHPQDMVGPHLAFRKDEMGTSVFATRDLPAGSTLAFCRREEAITPQVARTLLPQLSQLSNRQCTAALVACHKLPLSKRPANVCKWLSYVDSLPAPEHILSPMFYSKEELSLLQHTNLHGSTLDRRSEWERDHADLLQHATSLAWSAADLPFDLYLWACMILASRVFPSHLIDPTIGPDESVPCLLPGMDAFNHNPYRKVLWNKLEDGVALVNEEPVAANEQVFNSYGPKSNEELLFGYGFALPNNPADMVAVKLGQPRKPPGAEPSPDYINEMLQVFKLADSRHVIFRDGQVPEALLAQMRLYLADAADIETVQQRLNTSSSWQEVLATISLENELIVREQLLNMLSMKLASLDAATVVPEGDDELPRKKAKGTVGAETTSSAVRPQVVALIEIYKQGQREILQRAIELQEAQYAQLASEAEQLYGDDEMQTD